MDPRHLLFAPRIATNTETRRAIWVDVLREAPDDATKQQLLADVNGPDGAWLLERLATGATVHRRVRGFALARLELDDDTLRQLWKDDHTVAQAVREAGSITRLLQLMGRVAAFERTEQMANAVGDVLTRLHLLGCDDPQVYAQAFDLLDPTQRPDLDEQMTDQALDALYEADALSGEMYNAIVANMRTRPWPNHLETFLIPAHTTADVAASLAHLAVDLGAPDVVVVAAILTLDPTHPLREDLVAVAAGCGHTDACYSMRNLEPGERFEPRMLTFTSPVEALAWAYMPALPPTFEKHLLTHPSTSPLAAASRVTRLRTVEVSTLLQWRNEPEVVATLFLLNNDAVHDRLNVDAAASICHRNALMWTPTNREPDWQLLFSVLAQVTEEQFQQFTVAGAVWASAKSVTCSNHLATLLGNNLEPDSYQLMRGLTETNPSFTIGELSQLLATV